MSEQVTFVTTDFETWDFVPPDYVPRFIEELKEKIPKGDRWFNNPEQCWTVTHAWKEQAEVLLKKYWPDVEITEDEP